MMHPRSASQLLILALLATLASGCSTVRNFEFRNLGIPTVHRVNIQQGNVITQEMVDRLKPGMSQRQVRFVLGAPILDNTFRDQRWDYVYTIQAGARPRQQQRLTLFFDGDQLAGFEGDFVPSGIEKIMAPDLNEAVEAVEAEARS